MENKGPNLDNIEIDKIAMEAIRIEYQETNKTSDTIIARVNTTLIASSIIVAFLPRESNSLFLIPLSFAAISIIVSLLAIHPREDFLRINLGDIRKHKYQSGNDFYNYMADAYISSSEKNRVNNEKRFFKLKTAVFSLILSVILLVSMLIFKGVSMPDRESDANQANATITVNKPAQGNNTSNTENVVGNDVGTQKPVNSLQHITNGLDTDKISKK